MDYPIRIVAGNWFKLVQPLSKIVWENSTREIVDYEPAEGDTFKVTLIGSYSPYEMENAHIKEDTTNVLVYENNGTLPLGMHDIEIRVVLADGRRLRSYQTDIIKIVKTNKEASIPNTTEFGIDTFELQGAVFMYVPTGEGGGGDMSNYYTKDESDERYLPINTPIPSEVTEQTVSGWGFTKNTGNYNKPSNGIPKTDLAQGVQDSLALADSALQTQAQADWTENDSTKPSFIKHKPTIPSAQIQADWNQSDNTKADYIKNKPTIPSSSGDVNVIEEVQVNGVALTPDANKAVNVQVPSNYPIVEDPTSTSINATIEPNKFYVWKVPLTGNSTITLGTEVSGVMNEYLMQFSIADNATPQVTFTSNLQWAGIDTFQGGKTYQVSIVNGYAIGVEFDTITQSNS